METDKKIDSELLETILGSGQYCVVHNKENQGDELRAVQK